MTEAPDPDDSLEAARTRLYRPGATAADHDRYRVLAAASGSTAEHDPSDDRPTPPEPRGRLSRRVVLRAGAVLVLAVVAGVALGLQRGQDVPAAAAPSATAPPTALRLRDVPEGWRLASLVRRDDGMTSGSSLTIDRSVTGGEFLLLVRCPPADGRFRVALSVEGEWFDRPWTGECGRQVAVPLLLERGVGRVQVVITTGGDEPFAAAVVRRGAGSPRA